ncbi:DUF1761 domain-containing protein [Candidatus Parcubacteria bacterium]|nr:DUF1761 domain-containing protein [Candidatus Parcubacteria bacterium]
MMLNWWAIIVAAVAQWLLGWAWYGPLFGKTWVALSGHSMEGGSKKEGMKAMIWGLVFAIVMSSVLAYVISIVPNLTVACGALVGALLWLGFIAATQINSVLFERKSIKLFVLNSGYYLVALVVMGLILAAWR